jgi:hypothetical protein
MNENERTHALKLAREHREWAGRERELAEVARAIGVPSQAQRHILNAELHERRSAAYEASAKSPVQGAKAADDS